MAARLAATAEILRTIAEAPENADRSLQQIAETTARLFGAPSVSIMIADNGQWTRRYGVGASALSVHGKLSAAQLQIGGRNFPGQIVSQNRPIHIPDLDHLDPEFADWPGPPIARAAGTRTMAGTPLRRGGTAIGSLIVHRDRLAPFGDDELALLQSFADQAVIAIENARLFGEVQARTGELTESLQQQTATADVLKVISRSAFDLQAVFQTLVELAARLCRADKAAILRLKDGRFQLVATHGFPADFRELMLARGLDVDRGSVVGRAALERRTVQVADILADPEFTVTESQRRGGFRTVLGVPLLREGSPIGALFLTRGVVDLFTAQQIDLVTTFADQAVIAIENVRLFDEVQAKTADLSEALQQQTATADVLKVISRSTFDLQAVLTTLVQSARQLCNAPQGMILLRDGEVYRMSMQIGYPPEFERYVLDNPIQPNPHSGAGRAAFTRQVAHFPDVLADPEYRLTEGLRLGGYRALLSIPLLREGEVVGVFSLGRAEPGPFTARQIELVQTFADQAVIAIENVRLFDEVQARTADLSEALQQQTATAEVLKVVSRSAFDLDAVFRNLIETAARLCGASVCIVFRRDGDVLRPAAGHGVSDEFMAFMAAHPMKFDRTTFSGRAALERATVHCPEVEADPEFTLHAAPQRSGFRSMLAVPLLRDGETIGVLALGRPTIGPFTERQISLVETFADQAVIAIENVRLFDEVQQRTAELAASLDELRTAQDRLVQTEKLASLGQLTAGIAHEIKNPLNFVNNFSALSAELVDELNDVLRLEAMTDKARAEVDDLTELLKANLEKVVQHGKRADSIVKNMLLHSREGSGEQSRADINALLDESLNLAYHGARAEKPDFNVTLRRDFDETAGMIDLFPQEITRAFLNFISNGFYAVTRRKAEAAASDFEPTLSVSTKAIGNKVAIRIRDNGTGIPAEVKEKMFNPFFTTKPAGEGTGLGLSMSHDIIVKQHGGSIDVKTESGQFTEFTIVLPRDKA